MQEVAVLRPILYAISVELLVTNWALWEIETFTNPEPMTLCTQLFVMT